jgi:chorismate dehydratase
MSRLRVSIVRYLNTAPLVWGLTEGPLAGRYELDFTVPSACADALRAGQADIGIIPAIEYQRMEGMAALPGMAIASKGRVRSILLLARRPVEQVRSIALDTSSRSSAALVRVLARQYWRIAPEYLPAAPDPAAMLARADAALLIGDPALAISVCLESLKNREQVGSALCCRGTGSMLPIPGVSLLFLYDLVAEWKSWTGLPAVLAFWVGRRELLTPDVVEDFRASKAYGLAHIPEIARRGAASLRLPAPALESYLRENIDYSLDAENLAGLERFFEECARAGLIAARRPLELAAVAPQAADRVAGGIR